MFKYILEWQDFKKYLPWVYERAFFYEAIDDDFNIIGRVQVIVKSTFKPLRSCHVSTWTKFKSEIKHIQIL